jgi:hypothetical protein
MAPSTAPLPSTLTARGVVSLTGAPASAFAVQRTVADLAAALLLTVASSTPGVQVVVTNVSDTTSGAILYSVLGGSTRRRLTSGAATTALVTFSVLVPATVAQQAAVASAASSTLAQSGAGASGFSAMLLQQLAIVVAASHNTALAPGGVLVITSAQLIAPAAANSGGAGGASTGSSGAAAGAGAGGAVLVLIASGLLYYRFCSKVSPLSSGSAEKPVPSEAVSSPSDPPSVTSPLRHVQPPANSQPAASPAAAAAAEQLSSASVAAVAAPSPPAAPTAQAAAPAQDPQAPVAPSGVFISYAWGREEPPGGSVWPLQQRAFAVARAVKEHTRGFVWLDVEQLGPAAADGGGEDAMAAGIDRCETVVACVSKAYAASKACKKEFEYAENRRKKILLVNVGDATGHGKDGAEGWTPFLEGGWLLFKAGSRIWADCRTDAKFESPGGIAMTLGALPAAAASSP